MVLFFLKKKKFKFCYYNLNLKPLSLYLSCDNYLYHFLSLPYTYATNLSHFPSHKSTPYLFIFFQNPPNPFSCSITLTRRKVSSAFPFLVYLYSSFNFFMVPFILLHCSYHVNILSAKSFILVEWESSFYRFHYRIYLIIFLLFL